MSNDLPPRDRLTRSRTPRRLLAAPHELERWRWIIETPPGARPLRPSFGCRVHEIESFEDSAARRLAGDLIFEALHRWSPASRVRSVRVEPLAARGARRRLRVSVLSPGREEDLEVELEAPVRVSRVRGEMTGVRSETRAPRPDASMGDRA